MTRLRPTLQHNTLKTQYKIHRRKANNDDLINDNTDTEIIEIQT